MAQESGWRTLPPILPGADPVAALARELAALAQQLGLAWTVTEVRAQLEGTKLIELADELLVKAQARRLLLIVDQVVTFSHHCRRWRHRAAGQDWDHTVLTYGLDYGLTSLPSVVMPAAR